MAASRGHQRGHQHGHQHGHQLGHGRLTARRVGRDALGMLRLGFVRVVFVAALLFAVPAALTAYLQATVTGSEPLSGIGVSVALVALAVATLLRLFGPVMFAGFLDEAVGREYLFGEHESFREVVRKLPWLRLLVADAILSIGTAIGVVLLVVPGLTFYALFGLVGPVMVQERLGLTGAFRRTMELSRTALPLIVVLVVVPVATEHFLHELLVATVHDAGVGARVLVEWLVAVLIGATIGLLEVALAAELIARNPRATSSADARSPS